MKSPMVLGKTFAIAAGIALLGWAVLHTVFSPSTADITVIDYSGSTEAGRKQQMGQLVAGLESDPPHTTVTVLRMGATTEEIFTGSLDDASVETVTKTVKDETAKSDSKRGTNFANMAEAVEGFVRRFKGDRIRLRILSDGADDFKADERVYARYRLAAKEICSDPRLESVAFVGVKPGYRESVRSVWSRAGSRLKILNGNQATED